jgi:hypothetical protein
MLTLINLEFNCNFWKKLTSIRNSQIRDCDMYDHNFEIYTYTPKVSLELIDNDCLDDMEKYTSVSVKL